MGPHGAGNPEEEITAMITFCIYFNKTKNTCLICFNMLGKYMKILEKIKSLSKIVICLWVLTLGFDLKFMIIGEH